MPSIIVGDASSFIGESLGTSEYATSGALLFSGSAPNKKVAVKTAEGAITLAGTSSYLKGRLWQSVGGINLSEEAAGKGVTHSSLGAIAFSGNAAASYVGVVYAYRAAAGSVELSGAASFIRRTSRDSAGEIVFEEATAAVSVNREKLAAGSLIFSGSAGVDFVTPYVAVGAVTFTGTASYRRARNVIPAGSLMFIGAATTSSNKSGASVWDDEGNGATQELFIGGDVWGDEVVGGSVVSGAVSIWG